MNSSPTPRDSTHRSDDAALQVRQVSKSYGSTQALKQVEFELGSGLHVLLGRNGAGKSTLFQLITGLFVSDEGSIAVKGHDLRTQLTTALAHLGVVFQQPSLDLDLSVQANLTFFGRLHGLSDEQIRQRSQFQLEKVGLADQGRVRSGPNPATAVETQHRDAPRSPPKSRHRQPPMQSLPTLRAAVQYLAPNLESNSLAYPQEGWFCHSRADQTESA